MKYVAKVTLAHHVCATERDDPQKEEKLTTYYQVVNYVPATYAAIDVKLGAEAEITNFKHLEHMSAVRYAGDVQ